MGNGLSVTNQSGTQYGGYVNHNFSVNYKRSDILGKQINDFGFKYELDAMDETGFYARPTVTFGGQSYEIDTPAGYQLKLSPTTSLEGGINIFYLKSQHKCDIVFKDEAKTADPKCDKIPVYRGEGGQKIHLGARYKNENVNASLIGELGHRWPFQSANIKSEPYVNSYNLNGKTITDAERGGYGALKADVNVTPLKKNKNFFINANGKISTNHSPECGIGVGYKL